MVRQPGAQAIIFLTHVASARIVRHFERLREEVHPLLPAFLCVHGAASAAPCYRDADLTVSLENGRALLPGRYDEMNRCGLKINKGFGDLAYFPAMLSPNLARYDYFWLVEYDVDFAGDWLQFFGLAMTSTADLIGTALQHRPAHLDWQHWARFEPPSDVTERSQVRGFFPLARFSRRLIESYVETMASGEWRGHHEAAIPTIALDQGLTIADLGFGPYCPDTWRRSHYRGVYHPREAAAAPTFVYRPPVSQSYFHEASAAFPQHGLLYHPVKVSSAEPVH
ncbi:MAG: hypothetical protein ABI647_15870 [Gemmatimonadota bacterium]